ncbi:MAG: FAD-dependent oxidoreductase, partial [SAR324 cluster bacterium]|nr:FAD-dependent oxidoreductase [SAR324 cluster bacterium]
MMQNSEQTAVGNVLVVGAGISGIQAALDLAEVGYAVTMIDSSPAIGGILSKLSHQFPNDHCGMCKMLGVVGRDSTSQYCMRKILFHDHLKILPSTQLTSLQGKAGDFQIELRSQAQYVDTRICTGTGKCVDICPVNVSDEFNHGLTKRKAIYRSVPHNVSSNYTIDMASCDRCGKCVTVCPVDAINLKANDIVYTETFDAIIYATGTRLYQPVDEDVINYHYTSPNVVTSLEFERLLNCLDDPHGPVCRPSDGKEVKNIAWIQCVGSRNSKKGKDFCSSVCCMFALKEAVLTHKKGAADTQTTIFYMDMRTYGKDFQRYREQAEDIYGVNLIRCRVHSITPKMGDNLEVQFVDTKTGDLKTTEFDMLVLSTGQAHINENRQIATLLDLSLTETGHLPAQNLEKVKSTRPGIYMCGSATGFIDISESISGGSAAAGEVTKLLKSLDRSIKSEPAVVVEKSTLHQKPLIDVMLCVCNHIDSRQKEVMEAVKSNLMQQSQIGNVYITNTPCRAEGNIEAEQLFEHSKANRVLFGACQPHVYKQELKSLAQRSGFNPALVEIADLMRIVQLETDLEPGLLKQKLLYQLSIQLEKLKVSEYLPARQINVKQSALVVGGGVAGMRSALSLAERGIPVDLIEKSACLGGRVLKQIQFTLDGFDVVTKINALKQQVESHQLIKVHVNSKVVNHCGSLGCFQTIVQNKDQQYSNLNHGATIITTGGQEAKTEAYGYGTCQQIVTQSELENLL